MKLILRLISFVACLYSCSVQSSIHDDLLKAVKADNISEARELLERGGDPNAVRCAIIIDREKKQYSGDLSKWDDPVYTKPWVEPPHITTRITGK